ncbi:ankyrin repeat-containing protein [Rutstroemia sp. NJR-2017a BVV2]|nr:ankyrin repeat-containing protein [Rutstroemia sp. NJR-2017a BVV2]
MHGNTPLLLAAIRGHKDIVQLLLATDGVDLNCKSKDGQTPLSCAAQYGHKDIVQLLLATDGIDLNCESKDGQTPLSWAAQYGHKDIVQLLLATDGVDLNCKSKDGQTPLSCAAQYGHKDIVQLLLATDGIDLNCESKDGQTPLSWAVQYGHKDIVELLLATDGVDLNCKSKDGQTSLSWAAQYGHKDIVQLLLAADGVDLNCKNKDGETPLSWAAFREHKDIVELLLATDGVDLNCKSKDGQTPLSWAAFREHKDIVELLLATDGVDLNCKSKDGQTPLSCAAQYGHKDIVQLLLTQDSIDLDCKDKDNRTPLSWAAQYGHKDIVQLLLTQDSIDLDCKDKDNRTPLSWAAGNGHSGVVQLLIKKYANIYPSRTPLSWAAENGYKEVVKLLLEENDVDPNSKDGGGLTPLSRAAEKGHTAVVELLARKDTITLHRLVQEGEQTAIKLLLTANYDVHVKNGLGRTPLHIAASLGYLEIARDLISGGAEINSEDSDGMTPLRLAMRRKNCNLIRELLRHKAHTKDIMAKEWRDAFCKENIDIVQLSERGDQAKRLEFPTGFPTALELLQSPPETERRLFLFADDSGDSLWAKVPIIHSKEPLEPNKLQISLPKETNGHGFDISISLWFPVEQQPSQKHFSIPNGSKHRIGWKIVRSTNTKQGQWTPIVYFSTLPYGWIPRDGIDFFQQFILYMKGKWLELCQQAEEHLSKRRLDQLVSKGKSPDLIDHLAKDALEWTELRSILQGQVREAKKFVLDYCQRYNANEIPKDLEALIDEFAHSVNNRIGQLDQTVRDLLQIEFAWTSITEARVATRLGQNVMLLTFVSIFYLPLGFCANFSLYRQNTELHKQAIWAIPGITDSSTRNPFIITSIIVGLITLLVAFNLENIAGSTGKVYQYWRQKMLNDMRSDNRWKEKGEEFQDSGPARRTPSEWWFLGYIVYRLIRWSTRKTRQNKGADSNVDSGNAC